MARLAVHRMQGINRRKLLGVAGLAVLGGAAANLPALAQETNSLSGPRFFNARDFGATGGGATVDTAAINKAIEACASAGGGTVYLPAGTYLSGTIVLKSNVTLYLEGGATLLGSKNISDYFRQPQSESAKASYEQDLKDAGPFHLIFARDAENVRLAGPGKIDGQGAAFWLPTGRKQPKPQDAWEDVVAFDWKPNPPRPSPMLEFYNCRNLQIEGVRIENSAGWTLRPIHCDNVFIRGISIKNRVYGPNTDGIDVTCCHNVFISDCLIDTGDDVICLKSENPYGEELRVSKNITVTNCVLSGCCNGLKIGTATHGGFENIVFSNSVIFNDNVPLNARMISGIALEMVDGGWVDGVLISNIRMQRVRTPIFIRRGNRKPRPDGSPGTLRGVMIENVYASDAILTSSISGIPGFDVEDVTLSNIRIQSEENGKAEWVGRKIPEAEKSYPEARDFGRMPAYGFYCRHVAGLRLENVELKAGPSEERPAICCDDVKDLEVSGLRSTSVIGDQPVIRLIGAKGALVRGCSAPAGTKAFIAVEGGETARVTVMGNDLRGTTTTATVAAGVAGKAVAISGNVGSQS